MARILGGLNSDASALGDFNLRSFDFRAPKFEELIKRVGVEHASNGKEDFELRVVASGGSLNPLRRGNQRTLFGRPGIADVSLVP